MALARSINRRSLAAGVVLAAGLAAAACQPEHRAITQDAVYDPSEFRYATANKDVRTVIHGNPFADGPERRARLENVVLNAMQPVNWGFELPFTPRTRFTTRPDSTANENYRIEVSFRPEDVAAPALICAGGGQAGSEPETDGVTARMAFCYRSQLLSTSVGHLDTARGLDDPLFHSMIAHMTRDLFPQRDFRDGDFRKRGARFP